MTTIMMIAVAIVLAIAAVGVARRYRPTRWTVANDTADLSAVIPGQLQRAWRDDQGNAVAVVSEDGRDHGVAVATLPTADQHGHVTIQHADSGRVANQGHPAACRMTIDNLVVDTDNVAFASAVLTPHVCYQLALQRSALTAGDTVVYDIDEEHLTITRPDAPFRADERDTVALMLGALSDTLPHPTEPPNTATP